MQEARLSETKSIYIMELLLNGQALQFSVLLSSPLSS